jgi:hypothetical protein
MLLFETFPEATLFAQQLAKRSGKVVRLWPAAHGWMVENPAVERKLYGEQLSDYECADSFNDEREYEDAQRLADDPQFPGEEAYLLDGNMNEDWMLDHGY